MKKLHPFEMQFNNMIAYGQINADGTHIEGKMPNYAVFIGSEESERLKAIANNDRKEMADGAGDVLICIMGTFIQYHYTLEGLPKYMLENPFNVCEVERSDIDISKALKNFANVGESKAAKKHYLFLIWNTIIAFAKNEKLDIEVIFERIAHNNLLRIQKDENGKVVVDENNKIIRKNIHPDLTGTY